MHFTTRLPVSEPVLVFAILLIVIFLSPMVFLKMKVPGIVGLIISGVILGPHALNILERDKSLVLFGTVGLLYLMFVAGLEIDIRDLKTNRHKSITFGFLTFLFPFVIGFLASRYILHYNLMASVLLASMFSTHTLLTYPIASRLGILQSRTIPVIVGGTMVTDGAVLLILSVITSLVKGGLSLFFFVRLFLLLSLFVVAVLWAVPRLGSWVFRRFESEGNPQFLFVLSAVLICGVVARLIGVEPIIGAFLAGLALNQLIPNSSVLMNRINFVGNTLFIPFFLIDVGMLVDFGVVLRAPANLLVALLIIVVSFTGKWLAAWFTRKLFRITRNEALLIWGMSSAHAAATIAVVIIGFNLKILDENVLNATVLLILFSSLGSSLITERAGRKIAADEENKSSAAATTEQRVLIPVAGTENARRLVDLAHLATETSGEQVIFPLHVLDHKLNTPEHIVKHQLKMEQAFLENEGGVKRDFLFRIDVDAKEAIPRVITELRITQVIMSWNGKLSYGKRFGPILDSVVDNTAIQVMICKIMHPLNTIRRIVVTVPDFAENEHGFSKWVNSVFELTRNTGADLIIYSSEQTVQALRQLSLNSDRTIEFSFSPFRWRTDFNALLDRTEDTDLSVYILARRRNISNHSYLDKAPGMAAKHSQNKSMIFLYPEQGKKS